MLPSAKERKLLPPLSAPTLLLAAVGGAAGVDAGTTPSSEGIPDDATGQVPKTITDATDNESPDGQTWIPGDRNHDGEMDERFRNHDGDPEADAGIRLLGADPPCDG